MKERFKVILLAEVRYFLKTIDRKANEKIIYNIRKSKHINDPELFKKLTNDIWEFRTLYWKMKYRLLAFWDKTSKKQSLVVATHGIIKKTSKVPKSEIEKAENIMRKYFNQKKQQK